MRHALEITDLVVTAAGRAVLRDVTWAAPRGRVIGVLGPPGSGKSALLRCLVGVQEIAAGEVRVLGERAGTPALRRRVGYAPGVGSIYPDLSVARNVRYFATVSGTSRAAAHRALAEVELASCAGELAGSLPVDLRARLSLACALVAAPDVLVLDERAEGLDPLARRDLWDRLGALAARGTTVVAASPVLDDAARCDRVLLLNRGRPVGQGTPGELLERTGATSVESAFVRLCDAGVVAVRSAERLPAEVAR